MPVVTTIGTAAGAKDVASVTVGTSAGNKPVSEIWLGTAGGNKLVFSALSLVLSGRVIAEYDQPDPLKPPEVIGYEYLAEAQVSGGTTPYSYLWSVIAANAPYSEFPDHTKSTFSAHTVEWASITFRCVATDANGASATQDIEISAI